MVLAIAKPLLLSKQFRKPPLDSGPYTTNDDIFEGNGKTSFSSIYRILENYHQFGSTFLGFGLLLTFLGLILFFEPNLLRLGNVLILIGASLVIGPVQLKNYFFKKNRLQATTITSLGIFLVLFGGRPRLGLLCEIFGLMNLFGNMIPLLLVILRNIPLLGPVVALIEKLQSQLISSFSTSEYSSKTYDRYEY